MKKAKEMLAFLFGENKRRRFLRMIILLLVVVLGFSLVQNLNCGYDKDGFYFHWQPAAEIKIEKK